MPPQRAPFSGSGPAPVTVVSVHYNNITGDYDWTFSTPIASSSGAPTELKILGANPTDTDGFTGSTWSGPYGTTGSGKAWSITAAPTNITFASGGTISFPQSGVTT